MGLPWRDGRSSGARWFRVRRIFGCVPVCGAGRHRIVRVFVGGTVRRVFGGCGSSAGPSEGGPGGEEVRGRDAVASGRGRSGRGYGAARSVIRSRRDGAVSSGFGRGRLCGGNRRRVRFRFLRRVRALPIFLSAHAFAAACRVKETGCLHRQAPRCHKEVAVGYLRMAATPGSSMPSMYSSSAPPPVDT